MMMMMMMDDDDDDDGDDAIPHPICSIPESKQSQHSSFAYKANTSEPTNQHQQINKPALACENKLSRDHARETSGA